MKKFLSFFAAILFAGSMMATDVEVIIHASSGDFYAKTHEWVSGSNSGPAYDQVVLDEVITANRIGTGNNGKYYSDWRFYTNGSDEGSFSIDATEGYELQSATFTYTVSNSGALYFGETKLTSGTAVALSGRKAVFQCKNTNSSTNGQVRLTKIAVTYAVAEGGEEPGDDPVTEEVNYYLVGSMTEWAVVADAAHAFAINPENNAEFMLNFTLAENDAFKVVKVEGETQTWFPEGMGNDYTVDAAHAGEKTVYFRPDGQGGEGWHEGYIFVPANEEVEPATGDVYAKKAYADIKTGDIVIITMQNATAVYAASNDQGTGAAPAAVAVTVKDDAITTDAINILWTVTKDGANITFAPTDSTALYCTNSNNGVRVGKNTNNVFSIDETSGYLFNNATNRFVGVYNNADFRCYTSVNSNIKDQTLAFFVKEASGGDDPVDPVEPEVNYYLVGSMTDWNVVADAAHAFTVNPENDAEYVLNFTLAENDAFKVVKVEGEAQTWFPEGMGNDYTVDAAHAGEKAIYFRPDGLGGEGWHEGCIFVPANEEPVVVELQAVSAATAWDFSKITANTGNALYKNNGIQLTDESTPSKNDEVVYANYSADFMTFAEGFDATTMAFKGEYPIRKDQYCQAGTLHFKTTVAGKITVKFSDTGTSASATAVKRYLVVNGEQTEYWTSRENNGTEPYEAQLNVTSGEIAVPAGDVTITGSSAIVMYNVTFTPSEEPIEPEVNYYLVGSMTEWAVVADAAHAFTVNPENDAEYVLNFTLAENDAFKVVKVEGETQTWFPDGMGNDYTVDAAHAGEKTIYFRPDGLGGEGWHEGCIFVPANEEPVVVELQAVSAATAWDFSKITANTGNALYKNNGIQLTDESTPSKNDEVVYANYSADFMTFAEGFDATTMAFKGEYPIRKDQYCQAGTLHFKTTVAGKITVKFSDTGTSASATAVKRYLVVNGEQTEYWTSRENNGTEPYEAQLNVTSGEIAVPAGDVTITGSSAIVMYNVTFTPSEEPIEPEHTYTVAGPASYFGTEWNAADANNDMEKELDGTYKWEKTDWALAAGNIEFKVCVDHAWATSYPATNYQLNIPESGIYTVTITFNPVEDNKVEAVATKTGDAEVTVNYYLVGSVKGWEAKAENIFTLNAEAGEGIEEYVIETTLEVNEGLKVLSSTGTWYPEGMGNEYVVDQNHAGTTTIYFRPAGNEDWAAFGGYMYVVPTGTTGIEETLEEGKAVKVLRNGQVVILKGDKAFNVVGQIVR